MEDFKFYTKVLKKQNKTKQNKTNKQTISRKFLKNNKSITQPLEIANEFNSYFANTGPTSINHSGKDFIFEQFSH